MNPHTTLVLIGSHASGKSTLGRLLSQELGWPFHDEIGERLRRAALAQDPSQHALASQEAFDQQVTEEELSRDSETQTSCVVETWHPGNLAYAWERSPNIAHQLQERIQRAISCSYARILVQPLTIQRMTLSLRIHEPGPEGPAFLEGLLRVGKRAQELAQQLGLNILPPLSTDQATPNELCQKVLAHMPSIW